jgi:hypothetical protein
MERRHAAPAEWRRRLASHHRQLSDDRHPAAPAVATTTSTPNSTDDPASTAFGAPTVAAIDARSNAPAVSTTDDDSTSSGTPVYEGLLSAVDVLTGFRVPSVNGPRGADATLRRVGWERC